MKTSAPRRISSPLLSGISLILLALFTAGSLLGQAQLWGVNLAKFLPRWWAITAVAAAALFSLPAAGRLVLAALVEGSDWLNGSPRRRAMAGTAAFGTIVILGLLFRVQAYFLGDSNLRINQIVSGQIWLSTEPGDFFIHAALARLLQSISPATAATAAIWSYHVISAFAGGLFLVGSFALGRYLIRQQALVVAALMALTGMSALYFGYIESYAVMTALLPWTLLAGLKTVDGKRGGAPFFLLIAVGTLLHPVTLLLCGGMALMVLVLPRLREQTQVQRLSRGLVVGGVLALIILGLLRWAGVAGLSYYVLPLVRSGSEGQSILSFNHLLNLVNWLLLAATPAPVLLAVALTARPNSTGIAAARRTLFAVWTMIPAVAFTVFFAPHLGGPRDWDLFGLAMWLTVPSLLMLAVARSALHVPRQAVPSMAVGALLLVSLVAVNASPERSRSRFGEIIEVSRYKNLFKEYKTLYTFSTVHPELQDRRQEYAEKAWREPPYTREDSLFILGALADLQLERGDRRQAAYYIGLAIQTDSLDLNTQLRRLGYVRRFMTNEDVRRLAVEFEGMYAEHALGRMNAGVVYMQLGDAEAGARNLEAAFALDSANTVVALNYATHMFQLGRYSRSVELLKRVIADDPSQFPAHYYLAASYRQMGQVEAARSALAGAVKLAKTATEKKMVEALAQGLGRTP